MEDHQKVINLLEQRNRLGFVELKRLFYLMRNGNLKFTDAMAEVAIKLARNYKKPLQKEYYFVLQELFYSSLDLQLIHNSDQILSQLLKNFSKTDNVLRMKGVLLQATGNDDDATVIYEKMIQDNLVDQNSRKRRIALLRKNGEIEQSIQQLNAYLISFPQDSEAWLELADIYLEGMIYSKAQFCYEELLLISPNDQHSIVKIAELYYTNGGFVNLDNARNYYCYALSKNAENSRALWGLLQTLRKIVSVNKSEKKEDNKELAKLIILTIQKNYESLGNSLMIANYPFEKIISEF